jgi:hypothetical protein
MLRTLAAALLSLLLAPAAAVELRGTWQSSARAEFASAVECNVVRANTV